MSNFLTAWGNGFCNWGGGPGYGFGGGWHMPFMGGPFFLVLLVLAMIFLYTAFMRRGEQRREPRETPLEVLRRRYAAGDIGPDDYERMRKEIGT